MSIFFLDLPTADKKGVFFLKRVAKNIAIHLSHKDFLTQTVTTKVSKIVSICRVQIAKKDEGSEADHLGMKGIFFFQRQLCNSFRDNSKISLHIKNIKIV